MLSLKSGAWSISMCSRSSNPWGLPYSRRIPTLKFSLMRLICIIWQRTKASTCKTCSTWEIPRLRRNHNKRPCQKLLVSPRNSSWLKLIQPACVESIYWLQKSALFALFVMLWLALLGTSDIKKSQKMMICLSQKLMLKMARKIPQLMMIRFPRASRMSILRWCRKKMTS